MADFERFADWANEIAADPKRRAAWGLVLVFLGLAILALWHQRIYNTLAGPAPLDAQAAVELDGVPFRRLVALEDHGKPVVRGQLSKAVGREVEIRAGSTQDTAAFVLLEVGSRHLLVRLSGRTTDEIDGVLRELDGRMRTFPGVDARTTVYLDGAKSTYTAWGLAVAALGIAAIGIGLDQRRRARKPPDVRPLRRFT